MLNPVQSKSVNWWGYVEGEPIVLSVVAALLVAFMVVYLVRRFRKPRRHQVVAPTRSRRL